MSSVSRAWKNWSRSLQFRPVSRSRRARIAAQIWPESSEKQARTNLRNLLHNLKQTWPDMPDSISVEPTQISWRKNTAITVDVHRFETLLEAAGQCDSAVERISLLTEATDGYGGDLLPDCYDEWALAARENLRRAYASSLGQLVDALMAQRQYEEALQRAESLQRFDPLNEAAYRRLMQIYAALGNRATALRVYHTCASTLQHELGVEPSPSTEDLRSQLLRLEQQGITSDAPRNVNRQRLIGRHDEWRQLQDGWRHAQAGQALCILIRGEAGIGKTRLAEELIDWVQRQGLAWTSSRAYAVEGALTYAPIAEWLRSLSIRTTLKKIDDLWRVELARLLPELLADRPDLPPPGPMTEAWQQQRFFQSVVHSLQMAPTPLLLHLDDMQWCDAETLTLLQFLLHGARNHPLLLVGGIRTEDAGDNQALAAFIEALRHAGQLVEIRLGPLSAEEAGELVEQAVGERIESATTAALYADSEGHPLYLIEAVHNWPTAFRPASDDGEQMTTGLHGVSAMPPRIHSLLASRLGRLSPTARRVASMAAVIGRVFDYAILHAAVTLDETALIDALDELWQRRIIREQSDDSYDFSHDRIREVAYQEISRARRRLYHRLVAMALEAIHECELDDVAGELAAHFAQGGEDERAYRYYRRAAKTALDQYAIRQAGEMLDHALRHVPDDPVLRIELLQDQGRVYDKSLHFRRWRENLDEQRALLASIDTPDLHLRLAFEVSCSRYFDRTNELNEAVQAAQRAIALAETIGDEIQLVQAHLELGSRYWKQARMADAGHAYAQAAVVARRTGSHVVEARVFGFQVQAGMYSGMPSNQLFDLLTRALEVAETTGDKRELGNLYLKRAYLRFTVAMGEFTEIERDYQRVLELADEHGDRNRTSVALSSLGLHHTHRGDYRRAKACFRTSIEIEKEQQDYWRNCVTLSYLGALRMQMGALDRARDDLIEACDQLHAIENHHYEVMARCDLGLVFHLIGDSREAQSALENALTLAKGHGDLRYEALACTRLGSLLAAGGKLDAAGRMYERGEALHSRMGQHYYAMNALAGLASVDALKGEDCLAFERVATVWDVIGGREMNATIETARTLRRCYTIFEANSDPRADEVLTMAWDQLQYRASTIDDPDHVEQFRRIADHRFFRSLVERR